MAKLLEDAEVEVKSFQRRDELILNEKRVQKLWDDVKVFQVDSTDADTSELDGKFFATFPYPYMNGVLHVGHAFTISKAEFAVGFQRLLGKKILFPFGFHCTGMPIAAAAKKIKNEISMYGNPPVFPEEEEEEVETKPKEKSKGKIEKKKSKKKYQWQILEEMKVPSEKIAAFADPEHWLEYFPPIAVNHLKEFGLKVDWRRSFITTSLNPYYDSFIRWQFNTLRKLNLIEFGKRISIYSPLDGQACADHARASGEGVGPQEYTGIKMQLVGEFPESLEHLKEKQVFLIASTLRPETMYGQTNCWILPRGEYGAYEMGNGEVYVCSERAALNFAHQEMTKVFGQIVKLADVKGWDLLGKTIKSPLCQYEKIYILPLVTISMGKGTGIVTSVPSDAPDDFIALEDLKKDAALCKKYYITPEMLLEPVPVLEIPEVQGMSAPKFCKDFKVKNQHDRAKLDQAKEQCYKLGFFKGTMICGKHKGKPVKDVKQVIQQEMKESGDAIVYSEPEGLVISRSGDECVCALVDQWYLKYGEANWQSKVRDHVQSTLETYNPLAKESFLHVVEWLHEWACSRSFGLGTRLPWDTQFVIESLSDSTIYMAFYTIVHLLQSDLEGRQKGLLGISADEMTDEVWDFCFLDTPFVVNSSISQEKLMRMRNEFKFWYPLDLRVSGKDLIGNHLTMSLYNHSAIWKDPKMWPQSYFTNGHAMLNDKKMSKSEGNFMTLKEALELFGADATRFALADAGDGLEDANFTVKTANAAILRLTKEMEWISEVIASQDSMRTSADSASDEFLDKVMLNDIRKTLDITKQAFSNMEFRRGLKLGVFEFQNDRTFYRASVQNGLNKNIVFKFIKASAVMLSPICPHWAQKVWEMIGENDLIATTRWPEEGPEDLELTAIGGFVKSFARDLRLGHQNRMSKKGDVPNALYVYVAKEYSDWQRHILSSMKSNWEGRKALPDKKQLSASLKQLKLPKEMFGNAMAFATLISKEFELRGAKVLELNVGFDEMDTVTKYLDIITRGIDIPTIKVFDAQTDVPDPSKKKGNATPGAPSFAFITL